MFKFSLFKTIFVVVCLTAVLLVGCLRVIAPEIYPLAQSLGLELWFGGQKSLLNKIRFGSYFVSRIDSMELKNDVFRVSATSESTDYLDNLHKGNYNKLEKLPAEVNADVELAYLTASLQERLYKKTSSAQPQHFTVQHSVNSGVANWLNGVNNFLNGTNALDNGDKYNSLLPSEREKLTILRLSSHLLPPLPSSASKGVAVEDYNQDGWLDVVVGNSYSSLKLLINDHGKRFLDRTVDSGLENIKQAYSISSVDANNDGAVDLFVSRPFHHYTLLIQTSPGVFSDITQSSGLTVPNPKESFVGTWNSCWADVDLDGDQDLFLAQWGEPLIGTVKTLKKKPIASALWINQLKETSELSFKDKTKAFKLQDLVQNTTFVSCAFGDFNNDFLPDLALSKFSRDGLVVLENLNGSFRRKENFVKRTPGFTIATVDINKDGKLDIFQGGHGQARTIFSDSHSPHDSASNIFVQDDDGFTQQAGFFQPELFMNTLGVTYGDLDNNGCDDFIVGTGNPEPWFISPNFAYLTEGNPQECSPTSKRHFLDLPKEDQFYKLQGSVLFDFNRDGGLDLYSACGGFWEAETCNDLFFTNQVSDKSWLAVRLEGVDTNRFGVGSKVSIRHDGELLGYTEISQKTGFGSSPFVAHFGLDKIQSKVMLEIHWPVSKKVHKFVVNPNSFYRVREDGAISKIS